MSVRLGNKVIAGNYKSQVISSATTEQEGIVKLATENDITNLSTTKAVTPKLLKDNLDAKQDVIEDLDTIREGANKGATALQSIPSEYITETELESKGYLTSYTETDPVYTADKPNIATKDELTTGLSNKQNVISDLDEIRSGAELGSTALQSIPSEYVTETELESKGYLTSYTETDPIYTADKPNLATKEELTEGLNTKQDIISDLDTIREGASKGSTALQSYTEIDPVYSADKPNLALKSELPDLTPYATKEELNSGLAGKQEAGDYALKSEIPTNNNQLENSAGYVTADYHDSTKQDVISDLDEIRSGASKGSTALQSVPSEYVTETELNNKGYLTEHQDISNLATKDELTTGLSDKQDVIEDLDTIREGANKGATALQSVPSEYVTETELNSKGYLTEHQDISNLATKEEINSKQDKLVSGTTIKTINGESLLGSGNIEVKAGTQYAMVVVDHTV